MLINKVHMLGGVMHLINHEEYKIFEQQRDELLKALENMKDIVKQYLEEVGGCDHSVGICMCDERRKLEDAEAIIAKAKGQS